MLQSLCNLRSDLRRRCRVAKYAFEHVHNESHPSKIILPKCTSDFRNFSQLMKIVDAMWHLQGSRCETSAASISVACTEKISRKTAHQRPPVRWWATEMREDNCSTYDIFSDLWYEFVFLYDLYIWLYLYVSVLYISVIICICSLCCVFMSSFFASYKRIQKTCCVRVEPRRCEALRVWTWLGLWPISRSLRSESQDHSGPAKASRVNHGESWWTMDHIWSYLGVWPRCLISQRLKSLGWAAEWTCKENRRCRHGIHRHPYRHP